MRPADRKLQLFQPAARVIRDVKLLFSTESQNSQSLLSSKTNCTFREITNRFSLCYAKTETVTVGAAKRYRPTAQPCSGTAIKLAAEKPSTVKPKKQTAVTQ